MGDEANAGAPAIEAVAPVEGQDQVAKPEGEKPPEKPTGPRREKIKYKLEGKEVEEEVDFDSLVSGYRKSTAAEKRFAEAAAQRKQASEVIEAFKANPREAFRLLGKDAREWAESLLAEELEREMLSPQEREARELKAKLAKYEAQEKDAAERKAKEAEEEKVQAEMARYRGVIVGALQEVGVPGNDPRAARYVQRMATLLDKNEALGLDLEPRELAGLVKQEIQEELLATLGGLDEDALLKVLPSEFWTKADKAALKRHQSTKASQKAAEPTSQPPARRGKPESREELQARLKRIEAGLE